MKLELINGDCLDKLKELEDNSIDSIVTDPPYGLSFMGKKWDYDVPSVEIWKECLRVLKPGGHLLSFAGSRTYHRMAVRIEDAGFEIRDQIMWVYGSGFPKSLNVGKVLNKYLKTGNASWNGTGNGSNGALGYSKLQHQQGYRPNDYSNKHQFDEEITEETAKQWQGWGTALKPAHEPIVMARKPIINTVAQNVLEYGTGAINIDGCRVETEDDLSGDKGRWPANFIHDGSEEVLELFPEAGNGWKRNYGEKDYKGNQYKGGVFGGGGYYGGSTYSDSGSAARFFYCPKANKKDRDEGNNHPTIKPTELMRYLCRLVTPPKGIVLDPFMGSGSTGKAAVLEGFDFIGIEREEEYCKIAELRINNPNKFW